MVPSSLLTAVTVRRLGLSLVLTAATLATVLAAHDGDVAWLPALMFGLYLMLCAEPLRRIARQAHVSNVLAGTYVLGSLACVGAIAFVPVSDNGLRPRASSVVGILGGRHSLSPAAEGTMLDTSFLLQGVAVACALALWAEVYRQARRSDWRDINHHVGDGMLSTVATLPPPLGVEVARPVAGPDAGSSGTRRSVVARTRSQVTGARRSAVRTGG